MKNPKIDRCITRMVLGQPFYAALALRLKRVEDNTSKTAFWTDGITLAYNPAKVDELRDDQVMGAVCRLVEGLAHCHHTRRESRDAKTWNKASASVCTSITKACGFEIAPEDEQFVSDEWKDKSAETVYRIFDAMPKQNGGGGNKPNQGQGNGAGTGTRPAAGKGEAVRTGDKGRTTEAAAAILAALQRRRQRRDTRLPERPQNSRQQSRNGRAQLSG